MTVVAVGEDAARGGADAHGHDDLRLGHLGVNVAQDAGVAVVDRAGDDQHVGMLGVADVEDAEPLDVVHRRQAGDEFDVAPVTTVAVVMDDPRRF
jgi:hypothetical protein